MNLGGIMAILLLGVVLLPNLLDYEEPRRSQHTKVFGCLQYPSRFFDPRVQSRREGTGQCLGASHFLGALGRRRGGPLQAFLLPGRLGGGSFLVAALTNDGTLIRRIAPAGNFLTRDGVNSVRVTKPGTFTRGVV